MSELEAITNTGIVIDKTLCNSDANLECSISDNKIIVQSTDVKNKVKDEIINITVKSCKNITSKQALLIIPITKFFSYRSTLHKLIVILKGESLSLRLIDWFVTNYCKKFNIMYNLNIYRPHDTETKILKNAFDNFIIVHTNYKGQLKAYSKRNFDPFCRRNRIRFYLKKINIL